MPPNKIIHIDMDAFYASIEQRDNPDLKGCPVIVGGKPNSRGVVAACSYEARKFGVHAAMPSSRAQRLCPDAIFLPLRLAVYRQVSQQIHKIFHQFSKLVEPLSLDEAYLDVTASQRWQGSATLIAQEIKTRIKMETDLTASAGVSYNKFLAKIASDMDKPDGLYSITPDQAEVFIAQLPVGKFFGVGKVTKAKMLKLGLKTGADLKLWTEQELVDEFGKAGKYFYQVVRGIDKRPVRCERIRKSISTETTFAEDIVEYDHLQEKLLLLAKKISASLKKHQLMAGSLHIKVKYSNFRLVTRSITLPHSVSSIDHLDDELDSMLRLTDAGKMPVRLLGVGVSKLAGKGIAQADDLQLPLM